MTERLRQFVRVLDVVRVENHVPSGFLQHLGRKKLDRRPIARAFVAKAFYNLPDTKLLWEMLHLQPTLRKLCGFLRRKDIPSESTFSRAFREFSESGLGDQAHGALVETYLGDQIVLHVSRDSTAIEAREKPARKEKPVKVAAKRGRPKKGEEAPAKEPRRLARQVAQTAAESVSELPTTCDVGCKRDSKGHPHYWVGWKCHIDWADGAIPISVITTSASVHDSQVALPLMRITSERVTSLYDLMDSAYDAPEIHQVSRELGHVPLIDPNKRRGEALPFSPAQKQRFKERSTAERGNSRAKDEFGFRHLLVRGPAKAHLHLMFGILTLFADQLLMPMRV